MVATEKLYQNDWIEIHRKDGWYNVAHMPRGDGVGILIWKRSHEREATFLNEPILACLLARIRMSDIGQSL